MSVNPVKEEFSRTAALFGEEALLRLWKSRAAVCGVGGVGSYVAEALARTGVGRLTLVDNDKISLSNINRQLIALHSEVGELKVEVARKRYLDINPDIDIKIHSVFLQEEIPLGLFSDCDIIIDAIDFVPAKVGLAVFAKDSGIPIISAMGCGNKKEPSLLRTADIFETSVCPLCRVMRQKLRKAGIDRLRVVYSVEAPSRVIDGSAPASTSFVPGTAGLLLAKEATDILLKEKE